MKQPRGVWVIEEQADGPYSPWVPVEAHLTREAARDVVAMLAAVNVNRPWRSGYAQRVRKYVPEGTRA